MKVKFSNLKKEVDATFTKVSAHVVQLTGNIPQNGKGFSVFRDDGFPLGDYLEFTTVHLVLDGAIQFSDDESVHQEACDVAPETAYEVPEPTDQERIKLLEDCILELVMEKG